MSGDVFGNAMRSSTIKLIAAFDHRHIFLDPDPDPAVACVERSRLFSMPRSSWAEYDPALISPGGGVFPRTAKAIPLASQARVALGTAAEAVTADELIRLVLSAPVDLLFHGGVGTYVKSGGESHVDVSDRANDLARVDAGELRARVVAEGGNLGLTQRARIEFALAGGRVNTDFIDNSAGVDISDHEVNIKILLDTAVAEGRLDRARRNRLLGEVVDEVAALVLADNYRQVQAISMTEALGARVLDRIQQVMHYGESHGVLDRELEFLPSDEELEERQATGIGLARPEIAVMLACSKNLGYGLIMETPLPDDPYLEATLARYLPATLRAELSAVLPRHPMRRELIATALTNELHNRAGSGILLHLQQLTADARNHVSATVVARDVLGLSEIWDDVDALDLSRHANSQLHLLIECRRALERAALWFLRNRQQVDMTSEVARFAPTLRDLGPRTRGLLSPRERATVDGRIAKTVANGVPESLCDRVFVLHPLCSGMDIAEIAWHYQRDIDWTAKVYFTLVEALDLDWLTMQMPERHDESHWTTLAKASLRDDLLTQSRRLAAAAVHNATGHIPAHQAVTSWLASNADRVQLYRQTFASIKETPDPDLSMLSVALQELRNLAQVAEPMNTSP
jgi:glutamate dehydrogenase